MCRIIITITTIRRRTIFATDNDQRTAHVSFCWCLLFFTQNYVVAKTYDYVAAFLAKTTVLSYFSALLLQTLFSAPNSGSEQSMEEPCSCPWCPVPLYYYDYCYCYCCCCYCCCFVVAAVLLLHLYWPFQAFRKCSLYAEYVANLNDGCTNERVLSRRSRI